MKKISEMSKEELQTELQKAIEHNIELLNTIRVWTVGAMRAAPVMERQWPEGNKQFSEIVVEEIQKRDQHIAELKAMIDNSTDNRREAQGC